MYFARAVLGNFTNGPSRRLNTVLNVYVQRMSIVNSTDSLQGTRVKFTHAQKHRHLSSLREGKKCVQKFDGETPYNRPV
jgi:hypothetical protein